MTIPPQDRRRLLLLARNAIRKNLDLPAESEPPPAGTSTANHATAATPSDGAALSGRAASSNVERGSALNERRGAFVTLHVDGDLRGCVGMLTPGRRLVELVPDLAISASSDDNRFAPLTTADLPDLAIAISILTPPVRIESPARIEVGRHGLMVTLGAARGVLLPQVATEQGWDRETFLSWTCRKAGLDENAWHPWAADASTDAGTDSRTTRTTRTDRTTGSSTGSDTTTDVNTGAGADLIVETFTAEVFGEGSH